MKHRSIIILLIVFGQKNFLIAQDTTHIDTLSVRKVAIHHASQTGNGHIFFPTDETIDLYEWDSKEGFNIIYKPNGSKYLEGYYKKKNKTTFIRNGYFKYYNSNSTIAVEGEYKTGKEVGQWKIYDTIGDLYFIRNYQSKRKIFYYSNGSEKAEGNYKITRPAGREFRIKNWKFFYPNGNLKCEGKLNLFGKVGKWNFYNENGKRINEKFYSRQLFRFYKSVNIDSNYENVCDCK